MFLKKTQIKNRIFLEIVEGKRTLNNQVKHIVIRKLGFLDELPYDLDYYQKHVEDLNQRKKEFTKTSNYENVYKCLSIGSLFIKAIYEKYGWNRMTFLHKTRSENQRIHQRIEEIICTALVNKNNTMNVDNICISNQLINQGITLLNKKTKDKKAYFNIYMEQGVPYQYQLLISLNREYQILDVQLEFSQNQIRMNNEGVLFENRMMKKEIFITSSSKFIIRVSPFWDETANDYISDDVKKRRCNVKENVFYYVLPKKKIIVHNLLTKKEEDKVVQVLLVFDEYQQKRDEWNLKHDYEDAQNICDEVRITRDKVFENRFLLKPHYDEWMKTDNTVSIDIERINEIQKFSGFYFLITDDLTISHQELMEVNLFRRDLTERMQNYQKKSLYETQLFVQVIEIIFLQFMRIQLSVKDLSILELKKCLNQYCYLTLDAEQYLFYLENPKFAEICKDNNIELLLGICTKKQIQSAIRSIRQRI